MGWRVRWLSGHGGRNGVTSYYRRLRNWLSSCTRTFTTPRYPCNVFQGSGRGILVSLKPCGLKRTAEDTPISW